MAMSKYLAYFTAFVIMFSVMYIPKNITINAVKSSWYRCIRPEITPPNYIFPIVWTILYILIGIALAQTLLLPETPVKYKLLLLYFVNLTCNVLWSFLYFKQQELMTAFLVLLLIIITTAFILYYTYNTLPRWVFNILIPYQAWILFAAVLNYLSMGKKC